MKIMENGCKCYFISKPKLCGGKHYIYPDWFNLKTLEFDHGDSIYLIFINIYIYE